MAILLTEQDDVFTPVIFAPTNIMALRGDDTVAINSPTQAARRLFGGTGHDALRIDNAGTDTVIFGEEGNDQILIDGFHAAQARGGAGNDRIQVLKEGGQQSDLVSLTVDGTDGNEAQAGSPRRRSWLAAVATTVITAGDSLV